MKTNILFRRISINIIWLWIGLFSLLPLLLVFVTSFLSQGTNQFISYHFSLHSYAQLFSPLFLEVFARSLCFAIVTTLCCLVIAYPFAFILARLKTNLKPLLLLLVIIPFWTSSLLRSYAVVILLEANGPLNSLLIHWHIIDKPLQLLYTNFAVVIGLVYSLLPFMIMPLYANIEKLDQRLIDAARDLGANQSTVFAKVVLPLTMPGILSGILLVLLPAMTMFYIPDLLGGAKSLLLGNLIKMQYLAARNWPMGSAVSIGLTVLMGGILLIYWRFTSRRDRQALV